MKGYQFTPLIWEEDGVYVSKCMDIELSSCGDTQKEARENLREAIGLWLENAEIPWLLSNALPPNNPARKMYFCYRG